MCTYVGPPLPPIVEEHFHTPEGERFEDGRGGKKNEGRIKIFERIDSKILILRKKNSFVIWMLDEIYRDEQNRRRTSVT